MELNFGRNLSYSNDVLHYYKVIETFVKVAILYISGGILIRR